MNPRSDPDEKSGADLDRLFRALDHPAKRRVLTAVLRDAPRRTDEFVGTDPSREGSDFAPGAVELYHVHLPKLSAAGFVDWDRSSGTIDRGGTFEEIRPVLELLEDNRGALPFGWP